MLKILLIFFTNTLLPIYKAAIFPVVLKQRVLIVET